MRWKNHMGFGCFMIAHLTRSVTDHRFQSYIKYSTGASRSFSSLSHINVLHTKAIKDGSVHNLRTGNYILNFYVKNHDFFNAQKLFDEYPQRNVQSWTILISGFAQGGYYRFGLDYFAKMLSEGTVAPNEFTCSCVLKCCANVVNGLRLGKAVHGWIIAIGTIVDVALENAILDLYVKFEAFDYAERLFEMMNDKNTVSWNIMMTANLSKGDMKKCLDLFRRLPIKDACSWNTMIDGCLQTGFEGIALELLCEMVNSGPTFNGYTFSISLALFTSLRNLELGKQVHGQLLRFGLIQDAFIQTSLVDMYCKCGQIEKANMIFKMLGSDIGKGECPKISYDDLEAQSITWSAIIAGYIRNGMLVDALENFRSMVCEDIEVNMITLTNIVTASANFGLLELGQQIHARILKCGCKPDVFLSSSMVDMYAKCGKLEDAQSFFAEAKTRNVVLWTAMISCYAIHGCGVEAIELFELMQKEGVKPNEVTFTGVLTACSHAGLIREGCKYFRLMSEVYGIKPGVEHFTSMVDLYGRAGQFNDAKEFIFQNEISHVTPVWTAFLSSCQLHKNIEMAKWVSEKLLELEPSESASYILLSKTCSAYHTWDDAANLRNLMLKRKVEKLPGQSWI